MHDRRKLRVVRHCERLQAAELPVGRFRVALISSLAPGCRNLCETRIEGNEDRKISHAEGDIDDLADFLRKPRTHLHDVSFIRAENADRTPRFIAAQAMTIRVMLGAGEMVAHQRLGILNGSLALGREEHGETAAGVRVLFKRRIEALLHYPDTRVVVSAVAVVVTCISLGKIEFTVGFRVVESLFDSKFNQVLRGHLVVGRRVISLEASLVAGGKIGVGWDTLRKPVVAGTGFKVPNLGFVNERYAKTFTAPLRFNDAAEFCSAFACGAAAAEQYVGDVVLGNARFLDVRINGKCGFRGEDRFRAGESHAGFVEAAGTVKLRLPVGNRRVAEGILRKRVGEVIHAAVRFAAVKTGLTLAGRMNDEVLGFKRGAVGAAGDDE